MGGQKTPERSLALLFEVQVPDVNRHVKFARAFGAAQELKKDQKVDNTRWGDSGQYALPGR
jgi:hypothetical protein